MGKLALTGGKPVLEAPLQPAKWPVHDGAEREALCRVADSGCWQQGQEVAEFEKIFAHYQNAQHGICANNGTVTMEIALRAFGVGVGDEVVIPPLTFCATGLCVLMVGAVPVFADVEEHNGNLSPDAFEAAVTERTKAVIPVHVGGISTDMDGITAVARKHGIKVLEDAAHAHGCEWNGRRLGAIGDVGSFSFQSGKVMTSGDGGILVTNDDKLAALCRSLRTFGYSYPEPLMTSNWRLSEFQAAVLKVQFVRLESQIAHRLKVLSRFNSRIAEVEGIKRQVDPRVTRHNGYIATFRYDASKFKGLPRAKFIEALRAEGVGILGTGYSLLYQSPLFQKKAFGASWAVEKLGRSVDYGRVRCPVAERLANEEHITLDYQYLMGRQEDMDALADAIVKIQENAEELL
jgi:dTDP-4-amino-4,6-dideoxygalactose transaminase